MVWKPNVKGNGGRGGGQAVDITATIIILHFFQVVCSQNVVGGLQEGLKCAAGGFEVTIL